MKSFCILIAFLLVGACATQSHKERMQAIKDNVKLIDQEQVVKYSNTITESELKNHLYIFASEAFQGRGTGTAGQKLSAEFLERYYRSEEISSPLSNGDYFQEIPSSYFKEAYKDTENVLAFIKGNEFPEEVVVVSAHYDHIGIHKNGDIYYGADDDGSGTVALMEMAQAFKMAKDEGLGPKRSILFLHTTAEEIGLQGSRFYTENPVFTLENTIANLNIDMIGRTDFSYDGKDIDYVYIIGSNRLSNELHFINEAVNDAYVNLELNYRYNAIDDKNPRRLVL